ncbi:DsbA family oxidoreductase [Roseococcus sp. SDR]|uniref:DsbA family oxidoreductase n=1 Tax=Roseococcus sp. SDR TaxID=2835532 RepID=UPI001BD176DD|nr:DsbA family oxidoreductase [Roseococcus sp. SDR]MBS7789557.1 DsbA family oxidoreductase [Roseococcus sp. SDR]MBV1844871.1 DsbA family oxidoreductase [Roseococcus sp. SDR]
MEQPRRIDVISDAICPWCWIGKRQMERALAMLDQPFTIHWRPYQLNPEMPVEGVERAAYRAAKFGSVERGAELDANVAQAGRGVGLEFRHDRMLRTPNTIAAHRLIRWAGEKQNEMVEALFQAYFHDGKDIGDHATLAAIAATLDLDAAAFLASDEHEAEVRAEDAHFRRIGINGVPSFALDGQVMFSGAYPAEHMAQIFGRRAA